MSDSTAHHDRQTSWPLVFAAFGLSTTTTFSVLLLVASLSHWTFDYGTYRWITENRATMQFIVQLLSNALALVYVSVLCGLINRATRIYWRGNAVRLNAIRFWNGLCTRSMEWTIPIHMLIPLLLFILLTAAPSAIWAGALTPVQTVVNSTTTIDIPSYQNTSNIKEWPSEINAEGPVLRNRKGLFTYSVGLQMQASLLTSASSAVTVDGSVRQHEKLDNSRFIYNGRSFGVGSGVGLVDDTLTIDGLLLNYSYQEIGYNTQVFCEYNATTEFVLNEQSYEYIYEAYGRLPNSGNAGPEASKYVGHSPDAIVAIGVGRNPEDPRRMLGIAAGDSYRHLNTTQCSMNFQPTRFNVSIATPDRNITVSPIEKVDNFEDGGNLTHALMRQFEIISNDQTNLYVSVVGNSFNVSISNYITAHGNLATPSLEEVTLPALETALEAMVDDMLVAYASAQIMIQEASSPVKAWTTSNALRVGADIYIRTIFVVNTVILLLVAFECYRTKAWRCVPAVDYLNPGAVIIASSRAAHESDNLAGHGQPGDDGDIEARLSYTSLIVLEKRNSLPLLSYSYERVADSTKRSRVAVESL